MICAQIDCLSCAIARWWIIKYARAKVNKCPMAIIKFGINSVDHVLYTSDSCVLFN